MSAAPVEPPPGAPRPGVVAAAGVDRDVRAAVPVETESRRTCIGLAPFRRECTHPATADGCGRAADGVLVRAPRRRRSRARDVLCAAPRARGPRTKEKADARHGGRGRSSEERAHAARRARLVARARGKERRRSPAEHGRLGADETCARRRREGAPRRAIDVATDGPITVATERRATSRTWPHTCIPSPRTTKEVRPCASLASSASSATDGTLASCGLEPLVRVAMGQTSRPPSSDLVAPCRRGGCSPCDGLGAGRDSLHRRGGYS